MNMNKVVGFIAGILIAAGLWWFGFGALQPRLPVEIDPRVPDKTETPVENMETPAPALPETQPPLSGSGPGEHGGTRQTHEHGSDLDALVESIPAEAATVTADAVTADAAAADTSAVTEMPPPETTPAESTHPDTEAPFPEAAAALAPQKHYIWKPFTLKRKAEGFARHVSAKSAVACEVEKTGAGQYSIFITYTDEADLAVKRNLIEAIGISLDTTN